MRVHASPSSRGSTALRSARARAPVPPPFLPARRSAVARELLPPRPARIRHAPAARLQVPDRPAGPLALDRDPAAWVGRSAPPARGPALGRGNMWVYILKRLLLAIPTVLG